MSSESWVRNTIFPEWAAAWLVARARRRSIAELSVDDKVRRLAGIRPVAECYHEAALADDKWCCTCGVRMISLREFFIPAERG